MVVEESPKAAAPFPRLTNRLALVEAKLATATDPALRRVLEDRQDRLQRQLARKIQKRQPQVGGSDKNTTSPDLPFASAAFSPGSRPSRTKASAVS